MRQDFVRDMGMVVRDAMFANVKGSSPSVHLGKGEGNERS